MTDPADAAVVATVAPFFFGARHRRLYGVYHPAAARGGPVRAMVLCHPWGPEYAQAHRSVRVLADLLAAAGIHTLRFDYYGTGDSGGELIDGTIAGWRDDVRTAVAELRDITGADRVAVAGLRFGALVAGLAAGGVAPISSLVLWDPIEAANDHFAEYELFARRHSYQKLMPSRLDERVGGGFEVFGFPVSTPLRREAETLTLDRVTGGLAIPVALVASCEPAAFEPLAAALPGHSAVNVPAAPPWIQGNDYLPRAVLSAVVDAAEGQF